MKKLLFVFCLFFTIMIVANAQSSRFGFSAGTSIANYKFKYGDLTINGDSKVGITAGILVDIPTGSNFIIQPALNFVQKGTTSEEMGDKLTTSINCLEIPLNLMYRSPGKSGSFFVGAGPSFAFNMSGKMKYEFNDGTPSEEDEIQFGSDKDNDDIKSFDMGVNFLAGYEFSNGLFLSAGSNLGLSNLSVYSDEDESIKSNYVSIKIGFMLKGKK